MMKDHCILAGQRGSKQRMQRRQRHLRDPRLHLTRRTLYIAIPGVIKVYFLKDILYHVSEVFLACTYTGKPPSIGRVKLLLLTLSPSKAGLKSNRGTNLANVCTATNCAIFFPRHTRGPPLKTGNSAAERCIT